MISDQRAFHQLLLLLNQGQVLQLEKIKGKYEISIWKDPKDQTQFSSYEGKSLTDLISEIVSKQKPQ